MMQAHNRDLVCVASLSLLIIVTYNFLTPTYANIYDECRFILSTGAYQPSRNVTELDAELLEFALNLEFLEAEYFLWSAFGFGLDKVAPYLTKGGPPPIGVQIANLDEFTRSIAAQFGLEEVDHVTAIMKTVGGFPRPFMNLGVEVWAMLMDEAFGFKLEPPFNPYEDGLKFLLGSYFIPYIGLTGYVGANPSLQSSTAKRLLAGLLGIEAGQDAVIRAYLYARKHEIVPGYKYTVAVFTGAISVLRNRLGRTGVVDEGVVVPKCLGAHNVTTGNILAGDRFSMAYARTPEQILRILYGTGDESIPGAYYPKGASGRIARQYLGYNPSYFP